MELEFLKDGIILKYSAAVESSPPMLPLPKVQLPRHVEPGVE